MANSGLQHSIKKYEDALKDLTANLSKKDTKLALLEEKLLRVLVARDVVETHLSNEAPLSIYDLKKICDLDDWSKDIKKFVAEVSKLDKWRRSLKPSPEAWWWFPKSPALDSFLSWLSFFFLIVSFGLFSNIAPRFFSGGSDLFGLILISVPSALGFLSAKGLIPLDFQEEIRNVLSIRNLPDNRSKKIRLLLNFLFLLTSIIFYLALPLFSRFYYWWGVQEAKNSGYLGSIQSKYNRAVLLNPGNTSAHFNLGSLYEKMQMIDRARSEYKIATIQGGNSSAYSNLARLEILDKKYPSAIALTNEGLNNLEKDEPDLVRRKLVEYALRKNLGWARLGQKRYEEAQEQLNKAIALIPEKASAHCLIAQVFEAENKKVKSLFHWQECFRSAKEEINKRGSNRFPTDEDSWLGQANSCLKSEYRNKQCLEKAAKEK